MTKSRRRQRRDEQVLRGSRLRYNAVVEKKYQQQLDRLFARMVKEVNREVKRLMRGESADEYFDEQEEAAAMDASIASQARILMNKLTRKFTQLFEDFSKPLAEGMVDASAKASAVSLSGSLKEMSANVSLKTGVVPAGMEEVAKSLVAENVNLIKSIPEQYLKNVTGSVMRSITFGGGLADLIPALGKHAGVSQRRIKNIALDQTRKAYNSINRQRMQSIGIKQFQWVHSGGGQRPRQSHIDLANPNKGGGNIFSFDNLPVINQEQVDKGYEAPVRGIPGQAINCRCTMIPVINFDDSD